MTERDDGMSELHLGNFRALMGSALCVCEDGNWEG